MSNFIKNPDYYEMVNNIKFDHACCDEHFCAKAVKEAISNNIEAVSVKSDRDLWRNLGFIARQACPFKDGEIDVELKDVVMSICSYAPVSIRQLYRDGKLSEVEL